MSQDNSNAVPGPKLAGMTGSAGPWCPDRCPITLRPFFMWLEHPEKGMVPTYGGPFDSYTIPEPEIQDGKVEFHDIEWFCERYDHDEGCWVEGFEDPGMRIILAEKLQPNSGLSNGRSQY